MTRRRKVFEGRGKILYEGPESGTLVQHFKDDAEGEHRESSVVIDGKGVLNNRISEFIFENVAMLGIPTHFVRTLNMREQVIRHLDMIPLVVVVRNFVAGSLEARIGLAKGAQIPRSIIEFYYKHPKGGRTLVSDEHATALGWASPAEVDELMSYAIRINDFLYGLFLGVNIRLVDIRLEFGREIESNDGRLVVGDEISPDSCRLWTLPNRGGDAGSVPKNEPGERLIESYTEIARRLGIYGENSAKFVGKPVLVT